MNRKLVWMVTLGALLLCLGGAFKYHTAKVRQRVQRLIVAVGEDEAEVRVRAIRALSGMGSAADPAVPALLGALSDEYPGVRIAAGIALYRIGRFGQPEDSVVTALIVHLDDKVPEARVNAAQALGRLGWLAWSARPALLAAHQDENFHVREAAREALQRIDRSISRRLEKTRHLTPSDNYPQPE